MGFMLWFDHFSDSRAEIFNFFVGILVQTMTPKGQFEINWPLGDTLMIQMIPSHHNRLDTSSGHKVIPKCDHAAAGPLAVKPSV